MSGNSEWRGSVELGALLDAARKKLESNWLRVGGNITDLTTRLAGGLYILGAEVDLPRATDVAELETSLQATAERLGVGVSVRRMESDEL